MAKKKVTFNLDNNTEHVYDIDSPTMPPPSSDLTTIAKLLLTMKRAREDSDEDSDEDSEKDIGQRKTNKKLPK
jgi:hypothetical protein